MQLDHLNVIWSLLLYFQSRLLKSWPVRSLLGYTHRNSSTGEPVFEPVEKCSTSGREEQLVVADLDGTLTRSSSSFPYFMLVALEAGSPLRGLVLLMSSPFIWLVYNLVSEAWGVQMLIFVSVAGLKPEEIEGVGRAVLCKFYLEDLHSQSYKVLLACRERCVVTANPRLMVEPFAREYLGAGRVIGTELHVWRGYCTGVATGAGVMVGGRKREAVRRAYREKQPDVGLGDRPTDRPFLALCKEAYMVPRKPVEAVPRNMYLKPLIFHDGRLAMRPTPLASLFIFLWLPLGFVMAVVRLLTGVLLPLELAAPLEALMGLRVRIRGSPPMVPDGKGVLYVCTHRTLLDPVFLSVALRRRVTAVTYSLSRVSEMMSPIRTVRLTRSRAQDARTIQALLQQGDLVICPEGTTCREPYLLRFSSLFAELTDDIVPVTMDVKMDVFHGSTARGFKGMDPFYFFMNLRPQYTVTFLDPLPKEATCSAGKSSVQVANYIQQQMARAMGYECTDLTRRDKYRVLAGNDGVVPAQPNMKTFATTSDTTAANDSSHPLATSTPARPPRRLLCAPLLKAHLLSRGPAPIATNLNQ